jgi:hypothetical protein
MTETYDCPTCPEEWCKKYPIHWYCFRKEHDQIVNQKEKVKT